VVIQIGFRAHHSEAGSPGKALESFLTRPIFLICERPCRIVANNNLAIARKNSRGTEQDFSHPNLRSAIGWGCT
jgi:hypothetical protein